MRVIIAETPQSLGEAAASHAARSLREAIARKGAARLLLSTGSSQLLMIQELVKADVDWSRVEMFHLDEYIGLPETHKASFRKYLRERFIGIVHPKKAHLVDGSADSIRLLTEEVRKAPIDLGMIGIGENAHIAFNDPPADFETKESFIVVDLDERCKQQQVGEGWFAGIDDVPKQAVSMTIHQIMRCDEIISCVPYEVKARAVGDTLHTSLTNAVPATMLKEHGNITMYLDCDSSAQVREEQIVPGSGGKAVTVEKL